MTRDGLLFAHPDTKVYRVLFPLMARDRPNAPPELHTALDTIERIVNERITAARVSIAA